MRENLESSNHRYEDIIDLEHHVSAVHPQRPLRDRAAQFAPFSALSGFDSVLCRTTRENIASYVREVSGGTDDEWASGSY